MAFHAIRFPLDISLGARGGPERKTDIVTLVSGAEERNARWARSRRRYNAAYGVKSRRDMQVVLEFFEERRGRFHGFLWRDALDFSTARPGSGPAPDDQVIGTGDGSNVAFQLVKRYGTQFDPYDRPITKPVVPSVRIGVAGAEVPEEGFVVDPLTGIVTLDSAPAASASVTAGFEFDVPVRFDTDRLDVEMSSFDAALVPDIPVVEVLE